MNVQFVGGNALTPLDRSRQRFRITWKFVSAFLVPDTWLGTTEIANAIRNALPQLGLIPLTPIAAVPGDPFIQFTCQLAASFNGQTVADVVTQANLLPIFDYGSSTFLRTAVEVSEVEIRDITLPQATVLQQDINARDRATIAADAEDVVTKTGNVVGSIGEGIKDVTKFALGTAAIVAIVFVIVRFR